MKGKIFFSVIIPVRTITPYLRETIGCLQKQTEKRFEIIIVTDKKEKLVGVKSIASGEPTPAFKRNLGVKEAKGEILAFLDDDSYPQKDWLKNALKLFNDQSLVTDFRLPIAVCGPILTPPQDSLSQKASGWVWASFFGSGGAGIYRSKVKPRREVDDFPSVNLLVRRKDFDKVGGFDVRHWPGEDTKLCLDLIKLGRKIIYDPGVLVYHHRRPVFFPHLKQIGRYALRRGHFARFYPQTSFKLGYLLPSLFSYGLIFGLAFSILFPPMIYAYLLALLFYSLLLFIAGLEVLWQEKNLWLAILVTLAILATHLTYGFLFPFGYFRQRIRTEPHLLDAEGKNYLGG